MTKTLLDQFNLGDYTLKNRVVMAPLTRMRSSQPDDVPNQLNAKYYAQRASAGLIISEATQISKQGKGYPATPGIYSKQQVEGWKLVTKAVHDQGGKIFAQLWHVGRISHRSLQPDNQLPVAPSAIIAQNSGTYDVNWQPVAIEQPKALEIAEIQAIIQDYKNATLNAIEAGFDGVELHSANGYLLDQFLQDGSNQRTDIYGGSIENRCRLTLEILTEISKIIGSKKVGIRLSPYGTFNDMKDSDPIALFSYLIGKIDGLNLAYIHLIEPRSSVAGGSDDVILSAPNTSELFRKKYSGILISAGGYNVDLAKKAIAENQADAIAFGRYYISNPDIVARIEKNQPLAKYDRATFYGGGEHGYTDYETCK